MDVKCEEKQDSSRLSLSVQHCKLAVSSLIGFHTTSFAALLRLYLVVVVSRTVVLAQKRPYVGNQRPHHNSTSWNQTRKEDLLQKMATECVEEDVICRQD